MKAETRKLDERVRRSLRLMPDGGTLDDIQRKAWMSFEFEPTFAELRESLARIVADGGAFKDGDRWRWCSRRGMGR